MSDHRLQVILAAKDISGEAAAIAIIGTQGDF